MPKLLKLSRYLDVDYASLKIGFAQQRRKLLKIRILKQIKVFVSTTKQLAVTGKIISLQRRAGNLRKFNTLRLFEMVMSLFLIKFIERFSDCVAI